MPKDFYLNDQFLVKPDANLLIDGKISKISRVDPGVMQLLCALASQHGKTIHYDELVALPAYTSQKDEQLLRDISTLRDLLQDDHQDIILSTGNGFKLIAAVSNADLNDLREEAELPAPARTGTAQKWIVVLSVLIVLLLIIFILSQHGI